MTEVKRGMGNELVKSSNKKSVEAIHHLGRLSYGKSADGISVGSLVGNVFGCFAAQVREGADRKSVV